MANPVQLITNSSLNTGVTSTLTLTLPVPVTSGNAVGVAFAYLAFSGTASLTSITDDKGNTYTIDQNLLVVDGFTGAFNGVAHRLNITNGAQVVTITCATTVSSNIRITGAAYEVSGSTGLDVNTINTTSANPFVASFTTAAANEFAMMVDLGSMGGGGTFTQNNGWTQDLNDGNNSSSWFFHNVLAIPGPNTLNATPSVANHNAWALLVFNAAVAPPPVPASGPMPRRIFILP